MKTSPFILSLLSLLLAHRSNAGSSQVCGGTWSGAPAAQKKYAENAVSLIGEFTIVNLGTGNQIVYQHDDQPNILLSTDSLSAILKALAPSKPSEIATNIWELFETDDDTGSIAMMGKGSGKCISCQWGFDAGDCDKFGVPYACVWGPDAVDDSTLEVTKQQFYFIPATDQSSNAVQDNAVSDWDGCPKTQAWLQRHEDDAKKSGYFERHPACTDVLNGDTNDSKMKRRYRRTQHLKRGADNDGGVYQIATLDHMGDMVTTCLTGKPATAYADTGAIALENCDPDDVNQMWQITPVDDDDE